MIYNLDLTNPGNSNIKYIINNFPDGQQFMRINDFGNTNLQIRIKSRMSSWKDIELIICAVNVLRNKNIKYIELYVPYFLGARSDRAFDKNGLHYLKQVICPVINSLNLDKIWIMDPHSDVLEGCINNFNKIDNNNFYSWVYNDLNLNKDEIYLISPDAGALKRVENVAII